MDDLDDRLAAETALRLERERALAEARLRAEAAEAELANVRLTLSFGLGQALVEALSWRGLLALPRRLIALRHRQKAKRGRLVGQLPAQRPAEAMRFAEEARARAARDGIAAASAWITGLAGPKSARGRALAEAAIDHAEREPQAAAEAGLAAAVLAPREPRLAALAIRLYAAGALQGPARILARLDAAPLSPAERELAVTIRDEAGRAAEGWGFAAPASTGDATGCLAVIAARSAPWHADAIAGRAGAAAALAGAEAVVVTPPGYPRGLPVEASIVHAGASLRLPPLEAAGEDSCARAYGEAFAEAGAARVYLVLGALEADLPALLAATRLGLPVTLDIGWLPPALFDLPGSERQEGTCRALREAVAAATDVIARSPAVAEALTTVVGVARPIPVHPDPAAPVPVLQDGEAATLRRELDLPAGAMLILCPAALDPDPGLEALVDTVAALPASEVVVLLFTGDGVMGPELRRRAAGVAGVSGRVRAVGPLLPAERDPLMLTADLLVWPRTREGQVAADASGAAAVARAAGLPVIASAVEERWHGPFTPPPQTPLAQAITAAIRASGGA